jgi:hypothetical protein
VGTFLPVRFPKLGMDATEDVLAEYDAPQACNAFVCGVNSPVLDK